MICRWIHRWFWWTKDERWQGEWNGEYLCYVDCKCGRKYIRKIFYGEPYFIDDSGYREIK